MGEGVCLFERLPFPPRELATQWTSLSDGLLTEALFLSNVSSTLESQALQPLTVHLLNDLDKRFKTVSPFLYPHSHSLRGGPRSRLYRRVGRQSGNSRTPKQLLRRPKRSTSGTGCYDYTAVSAILCLTLPTGSPSLPLSLSSSLSLSLPLSLSPSLPPSSATSDWESSLLALFAEGGDSWAPAAGNKLYEREQLTSRKSQEVSHQFNFIVQGLPLSVPIS